MCLVYRLVDQGRKQNRTYSYNAAVTNNWIRIIAFMWFALLTLEIKTIKPVNYFLTTLLFLKYIALWHYCSSTLFEFQEALLFCNIYLLAVPFLLVHPRVYYQIEYPLAIQRRYYAHRYSCKHKTRKTNINVNSRILGKFWGKRFLLCQMRNAFVNIHHKHAYP